MRGTKEANVAVFKSLFERNMKLQEYHVMAINDVLASAVGKSLIR